MHPVDLHRMETRLPSRRAPVPPSAWMWLLGGTVVASALYGVLRIGSPGSHLVGSGLYLAVVVAGMGAIVVGLLRYRPPHPNAWVLVAAGYAFALAAETQDQLMPPPSFPSWKDAAFLLSYALFIVGLSVMARARISGLRGGEAVLDSLIVTVVVMLLAFQFVIFPLIVGPYVSDPGVSLAARSAAVAYLLADFLLLGVAVLLAAGGSPRPMPVTLVVVGVSLMFLDDVVSAVTMLAGRGPVKVAWLLSYGLGGSAAIHPSMRVLTEPVSIRPPRLGLLRVGLLVASVVFTPLVLTPFAPPGHPLSTTILALGTIVLATLVFARVAGLTLSMRAQVQRYEGLLEKVVHAKEQERLQVAADLHDGAIQRLASMGLTAELVRRRLERGDGGSAGKLLEQLTDELGEEVDELRRVVFELRPPVVEEMGLVRALQAYAAEFHERAGIRCALDADPDLTLDPARETTLYRVVQEVLTNVAKHAKARSVHIMLRFVADAAELTIHDDGVGFDASTLSELVDQSHFGLAGIRERVDLVGGHFRITSRPRKGTTVSVSLPPVDPNLTSRGAPPSEASTEASTKASTEASTEESPPGSA